MVMARNESDKIRQLTIAIGQEQNRGVNPYWLERLAAQRQSDYLREAGGASLGARLRAGRLSLALAGALRTIADRLDGGDARAKVLGAARALD